MPTAQPSDQRGNQRDGVDLADPWAAIEACYAKGWTDGLPVVPPTELLVDTKIGRAHV